MEILIAYLPWIQIVLSILLIIAILLQQTGAGVGGAFGGGSSDGYFHTRRGMEKVLFQTTIVLALLFAVSSFIALVI